MPSPSAFRHEPHPWRAERSRHVPRRHKEKVGANTRIAMAITRAVGTMWAAYAFAALALVSLPGALASRDPIVIVAWLSQTFLQLTLLAVIMVGQDAGDRAADRRAEMTYRDVEMILHEMDGLQRHLEHQDVRLGELLGEPLMEREAD